jgi:Protein of unknown function (DUF4238)
VTSSESNPYPEGSLAFAMREIGAGRRRMPESEAKRHHIVSRFLLARFAEPPGDNEGRIFQLDATSGATARVSVRTAATRHRFYSVRSTEAEKDNRIESLISLIEDYAAGALNLLLECPEQMGDHDRIAISIFIALQVKRTPKALARAEEMIRETAEAVLVEHLEDPDAFARAARGHGVESSADELEQMRGFFRRAKSEGRLRAKYVREEAWRAMVDNLLEAGRHPLEMEWYLLRPSGGEFVTSDNGVNVTRRGDGRLETALTLAPGACLVLTGKGDGLRRIKVPSEAVAELNLRAYADAERFIFGRSREVVANVWRLAEPPAGGL